MKYFLVAIVILAGLSLVPTRVEAKSYVRSYMRGGSSARSHVRYKADGYKFNNYQFRYDRGYRR